MIQSISLDFIKQIEFAKEIINSKMNLSDYADFLKNDFSNLKKNRNGVVYFFFVKNRESEVYELKYIGKSKGHLFKRRISNHFDPLCKHRLTSSKLSDITYELKKGNEVKISYILTVQQSLRNLVEEVLVEDLVPMWNLQKGINLKRKLTSVGAK